MILPEIIDCPGLPRPHPLLNVLCALHFRWRVRIEHPETTWFRNQPKTVWYKGEKVPATLLKIGQAKHPQWDEAATVGSGIVAPQLLAIVRDEADGQELMFRLRNHWWLWPKHQAHKNKTATRLQWVPFKWKE